jgi:hypothetical protein
MAGPLKSLDDIISRVAEAAGSGTIRAYHGSPYDFRRFSFDNPEGGEGAQAVARGLYFGSHPGTGEFYRHQPHGNALVIDGEEVARGFHLKGIKTPQESKHLTEAIRNELITPEEAEAILAGRPWNDLGTGMDNIHFKASHTKDPASQASLQRAKRSLYGKLDVEPKGYVYETEIAYPEQALLDWDSPLSSQPAIVERLGGMAGPLLEDHATGRSVYDWFRAWQGSPDRASRALLGEHGIPGVRYYDAGGRRGGGSRNYVMFPGTEDSIRILRKYGIMAPVAAEAVSQTEE